MSENGLQERSVFLAEVEAHLEKKDFPEVLDLARRRLERMPDDPDARIALCRAWIEQGNSDEAAELLRGLDDILMSLSRLYAGLGDLLSAKGMGEAAQALYRKGIALNPDISPAWEADEELRGVGDSGKDGEAGETQEVPPDFQTLTLAELYVRQGHLPMAAEVLETILRKDPHHERAAGMLRDVEQMILRDGSALRHEPVVAELSRWLDNIGRLRGHAA